MYTDDQYSRAKAQIGNAPPEAKAVLRQRIQEYELTNPQHVETGTLGATGADKLDETATPEVNVPALPAAEPDMSPHGVSRPLDITSDASLPNASKLKTLAAPPEYVSKNPLAGIKHVAAAAARDQLTDHGALDALSANIFYEPSRAQFTKDMGPVLKARGIDVSTGLLGRGSNNFEDAYNQYADRKWQQAYEAAAAEDRPLTRVAYVKDSGAWDKLKNFLAQTADEGSAFAKGYASAFTGHATQAINAASDAAGGADTVDVDREQANRNPAAAGVGEFMGSINPRSVASRVAGGIGRLGKGLGLLGRTAVSGLAGAGAADADLAGRSIGEGLGDLAHGRSLDDAKSHFTSSLLGATALGGGAGVFGSLTAEGANEYRKLLRAGPLGGELGNLEAGGGATDALRGVKPPAEVQANIEAARPPVPGEAKPLPTKTALEEAAGKVQGPLAAQNATDLKEFRARAAAESEAAYAADPELQKPRPMRKTAEAAVDLVKARTQPEARGGFLPDSSEGLPARNNTQFVDLAKKLWKPRLVTSVDAAKAAQAGGGRVISVDEATAMGLDVPGLAHQPDLETGVPHDAPDLPDEQGFDSAASSAGKVAQDSGVQNELQDFLNRSRRQASAAQRAGEETEESSAVSHFLAEAQKNGATYNGATYRGTSPEELAGLLKDGETAHTWSVSKDAEGAQKFAQQNGILLKIEPGSGAVPVDGVAGSNTFGEALIPRGQRFKVAGESTENGIRVVRLRRVSEPDVGGGSTTKDVFGRPADKPEVAQPVSLGPRLGRAKTGQAPVPTEEGDPFGTEAKRALEYGKRQVGGNGSVEIPEGGNTQVDNGAAPVSATPSGPPKEFAKAAGAKPPPLPKTVNGVPAKAYKVVLEPRSYNAKDYEEIIGALDDAAKAGRDGAHVDPAWKDFQRAAREDREQFGKAWSDLKAAHHEEATGLEQRAGHANLRGGKPFGEMDANGQKAFSSGLVNYGAKGTPAAQNQALRSLAEKAGVLPELETLRAQRATEALKEKATPAVHEGLGLGGAFARLGGLGPAVKLRGDAVARAVSRGPEGLPAVDISKVSPELLALVRKGAPIARETGRVGTLGNLSSLGGGALGLKAGSAYNATRDRGAAPNTLTPDEIQYLEKLLAATQGAP